MSEVRKTPPPYDDSHEYFDCHICGKKNVWMYTVGTNKNNRVCEECNPDYPAKPDDEE